MRDHSESERRPRSAIATLALLSLLLNACFASDRVRRSELQRLSELWPPPVRPVIVIPGFGHSRLYDPELGRFVWGTGRATMTARFPDDFDLPLESDARDRLVPRGFVGSRGPINSAWQLCSALHRFGRYDMCSEDPAARSTAYAFAYDWRLQHAENARRLRAFIDEVRKTWRDPQLQVDVVAHSSGGLVALAAMNHGATQIRHAVFIGSPLRGTLESFRLLNDTEKFLRRELRPEMSATFPSITELLPRDGKVFIDERGALLEDDLWNIDTWRKHRLGFFAAPHDVALERAFERSLERGRRAQEEVLALRAHSDVSLVAGECVPTARRILLRRDGTFAIYRNQLRKEEAQLVPLMFEPGDGSVTATSAHAISADIATLCAGHQGLVLDPSTHLAILRTLTGAPGRAER